MPQALNRYTATPLGQPGVFQSVQSTWNPFRDDYLSNIGKGVASNQLADLTTAGLRRYYRASLYTVIGDPIIETMTIAVSKNTNVDRYIMTAAAAGFLLQDWTPESLHGAGRALFGKAVELNTTFETVERVIGYEFSYAHHLPAGRVVGKLLASKLGLKALDLGIGAAVDIGYQALLDYGNPYLTPRQRNIRLGIQATGSVASFIVVAYFGPPGWIGLGIGIGVSIFWDVVFVPPLQRLFDAEPQRNLAPLTQ